MDLLGILAILIPAILLIYGWSEPYRFKKGIENHIKTCSSYDAFHYLYERQHELTNDKTLCFDYKGEDRDIIEGFIEGHRNYISDLFFKESYPKKIKYSQLSYKDFYMLTLVWFLSKQKKDYTFRESLYLSHEYRGERRYNKLNKRGVTFYKLYYIALRHCECDEYIKTNCFKHFPSTEFEKNIIKTGEVEV